MVDIKIPNLNKNSDKFFFKKKLSLRRKSKSKLIKESIIMFCCSFLLIYLNFLIPNKLLILDNFFNNLNKFIGNIINSMGYVYEICLAIFIVFSLIVSLILILGSSSRILKVVNRRTRRVKFK